MSRTTLLACGLLCLGAAPDARADTTYTLTETLIAEWLWDNGNGIAVREDGSPGRSPSDDYYGDIKNRLNLGIRSEGLDVGLRIDTSTYRFLYPSWMGEESEVQRAERERLWYQRHGVERGEDGGFGHVGDYRLERIYANLDVAPGWRLTGGDFYAHLGRGLILSLRKLDEMGVDTALRGARVDGRIADRVDLTLMGGLVNVANVDEKMNLVAEDPLDRVAAGRVMVDLWGGNRGGLQVAYIDARNVEATTRTTLAYGGVLEFPDLPWGLRFYGEVDGVYRTLLDSGDDQGLGAYAELAGTFGPVDLTLECKEYHDLVVRGSGTDAANVAWEYNRPPMVDQEDQILEALDDVRGGRVRVEYHLLDDLTLFAAFAGADDLNEGSGLTNNDAVHGYGGFEWLWNGGADALRGSAGYRHAWWDDPLAGRATYVKLAHAKLELALHLWGPLSLGTSVLHEEWWKVDPGLGELHNYRRGTTALSLDWSGIGGIFGTFEYDTQTEGDGVDNYFYAGGLQWNQFDWVTVRARAGSQRGGKKCVAGVCREFPPMSGVRLEVIFRL